MQSPAGCLQSTPLSSPPHSHGMLSLNASLWTVYLGGHSSLPTDRGFAGQCILSGKYNSAELAQSKAAALTRMHSHRSREMPQESIYSRLSLSENAR